VRRFALAAALLAAVPAPASPVLAVRAATLHLADGTAVADAVVLVKDGRVAALGSGLPVPAGARVREVPVAAAGFVDLRAFLPRGNDGEDPRPFAPSLRAADGLDPADPAAAAAAREGVLARLLLPSDRNPAGGRAAAVRVAGREGRIEVAVPDAGAVFSFAAAAARRERFPGSLLGIVRGLEAAFDGADPALGLTEGDRAALRAAAAGAGSSFLRAGTRAEVAAALRFAAARKLRPVLVDPRCGGEAILEAARAAGIPPVGLSVILVLDLDDPLVHLRGAGVLAKAGVAVGFGGGTPGAVRRAAALAVHHGMDPGAARGALLGRGFPGLGRPLAEGSPADLVLLDGDPVEPATRVLEVLAGGETVGGRAGGE